MLLERALLTMAIAAWLAMLGVILILFVRTTQLEGIGAGVRRVFSERILILLLLFAVIITAVSNAVVFIQPQEVAVVISLFAPRGIRDKPLDPGLHFILPIIEQVARYPTYYQTYTMSAQLSEGLKRGDDSIAARTADGQSVYLDLSVIYAIDPDKVVKVHLGWQDRYQVDYVRPLLRGLVRRQVSQFTVDEVNSAHRLDLENDLARDIQADFQVHGFLLDRFLLRNVAFSQEYAAAVEEKQVAQQGVLRDQFKAQQVEILASAEANALDKLGLSLARNPDVATLRYIEKIAPSITTMLLPNNIPFILPLPTSFSRQDAVPTTTLTPEAQANVTVTPTPTPTGFETPNETPFETPISTTVP